MNRADITQIVTEYPDLIVLPSPPTRGDSVLDVAISNIAEEITSTKIRQPLEGNGGGAVSDHCFLHFQAFLKHSHEFTKTTHKYRPMPIPAVQEAAEKISKIVWEDILPTMCDPDLYVEGFHGAIVKICEEVLPWKTAIVKSTDSAWITNEIRREMKRRKGIFKAQGRSRAWKDRKKLTTKMNNQAMNKFYDRQVANMKQPGGVPFKAIKKLKDAESPSSWELGNLFPQMNTSETLEKTADYFSAISQEFRPLSKDDLPRSADRDLGMLDVNYVAERMKNMKKPNSYVSIDAPPEVVNLCTESLATALTPVYNLIRCSDWWPVAWKCEEVSVIPKTSNPLSLDQTRNISCTSIFSKLAEEFMMEELHKEVKLDARQFGGRRRCVTEHLLAELLSDIMMGLEDNRSCVTLISLDYSMAFNRMPHDHCLKNLAKEGASNQTLRMVWGFLSNRSMKIKYSGQFSMPRPTPGGAPQGTKSGGFLFSIAADKLGLEGREDQAIDTESNFDMSVVEDEGETMDESRFDRTENFSVNLGPYDRRHKRVINPLDETAPHSLTQVWSAPMIEEAVGVPPRWKKQPTKSYKYVDDQTVLEVSPITSAVSSIGRGKEEKYIHASDLSEEYMLIENGANKIGMKLNLQKTQILCISDAKNFEVSSFLRIKEVIMESQEKLKILGYVLDTSPGANAQVNNIKIKSAIKSWTMRHLKKAGVGVIHLVEIYTAFIRTSIEHCSNIYGGYLTREQETNIERIQANILKSIYGQKISYRKCLALAQIPTLKKRRELNYLKWVRRVASNPYFRERWLPYNEEIDYKLRRTNKYKTVIPRCERMKKSPIYRIRETLNEVHREGKDTNVEIMKMEEDILIYDDNQLNVEFIDD